MGSRGGVPVRLLLQLKVHTMNLYDKEHFILIVITMFLLLHTGHSEAVIAVSFSPDGR